MTQGLALRSSQPEEYVKAEPRLRLLVEREPGCRIFFRNLADLVFRREEPPLFLASQPVHCTRHFYVRTGVRWSAIAESFAWHLAAAPLLLIMWTWTMQWDSSRFPMHHARAAHPQYELTYYRPDDAFPAREGREHQLLKSDRATHAGHSRLEVASEKRRLGVEAPDVLMRASGETEIASTDPALPTVPLSATTLARLTLPADSAEVVAPAPGIGRLSMRALGSPGRNVIAPAPQVAGLRRGGGITLPAAVVAPAPALKGAAHRGGMGASELASATVVPPTPELAEGAASGASSSRSRGFGIGGVGALATAIVPPPPSLRGRAFASGARGAAGSGSGFEVVGPSPALSNGLVLASGRGNSLGGTGSQQVVPPAPALEGHAFRAGGGRGGRSTRGNGNDVVGPAPSLGSGVVLARGNGNSLGGSQGQVIGPAPSLAGTGGFEGGGGRSSFGSINGIAVPPAPAVGEIGSSGGGHGRGFGRLSGDGAQVVGPAPALASSRVGSGNGGSGGTGFSDLGSQVLPPSLGGGEGTGAGVSGTGLGGNGSKVPRAGLSGNGSGDDSSGSGSGTRMMAGLTGGPAGNAGTSAPIISTAIPKQAKIPDVPPGTTEVLPLRVVQLALALPMSSFFSNYEAFVAERSVNQKTTQLIKLVYIFLPYQRRLTEFGVNTSKTFHLRVTRDPSCDESLISMTWPEGETRGKPDESDKDKLPCFRTTADDYRKAWEKAR